MSWLLLQGAFGGFWALVAQSGLVVQAVLVLLLFFSVLSWAIIIKKSRVYRMIEAQTLEFHDEFQRKSSLSEIYRECEHYPMSPLAGIFRSGYSELSHRVEMARNRSDNPEEAERRAVVEGLPGLERVLRKAAMAEMLSMEKSLNWLATTGSVTPFIGLFGTVVGIINAFQGLGEAGATTIQAVSGGISEALVATAVGLFAAIPAVIGYNHFLSRLRQFGTEMDDFSAEFLNLVERSFS